MVSESKSRSGCAPVRSLFKMANWDTVLKEIPEELLQDKSLKERSAALIAFQQRAAAVPRSEKIVRTTARNLKGVKSLPAKILAIGVRPTSKSPTRMQVMLYESFEQAIVPTEEGAKLSDTVLELVVHAKHDATAEELAEYAKNGSGSNNRKYTYFKEGRRELHAYNTYWISMFLKDGASLLKGNGRRFEVGDFVYIDGLHPTNDYGTDKEGNPTTFQNWSFMGLTENPTMNNRALYKSLKAPEQAELLNLGPSGEFSEDNWDEEGEAYKDECIKTKANPQDSLVMWNLKVLKMTRKARAIIRKKVPVSVPLQGSDFEADVLTSDKAIVFQKPYWGNREEWTHQVYNGETKARVTEKCACFSSIAMQFLPGQQPQTIKVATVIPAAQANEAGITDDDTFVALAPVLFPHCDGRALCTVDVNNSSELKENDEMTNPIEHGKRKMGVDFAVQLNTNLLALDLTSGLLRVGFHITPECAKKAVELSPVTKEQRRDRAAVNLLCKDPARPIINLLEYEGSVADLNDEYQYILLSQTPANKTSIVEMVEDMKEKHGDGFMEHMSKVIMSEARQIGWDVKLPLSSAYTVFAVKTEILEEYQPKAQKTATVLAKEIADTLEQINTRNARNAPHDLESPPPAKRILEPPTPGKRNLEPPSPSKHSPVSSPKKRKVTMPSSPPPAKTDDGLWD